MAQSIVRPYFAGLSRNTFLLALASLFADISTEMLCPVLPIFLMQTLNAGGTIVGLVEGVAQARRTSSRDFSARSQTNYRSEDHSAGVISAGSHCQAIDRSFDCLASCVGRTSSQSVWGREPLCST
jgi:hypothetical protein